MKKRCFDWAATSPMSEKALGIYCATAREFPGNPSAAHSEGRRAKARLQELRAWAAGLLGCAEADLYFTSGGTEADSIVLNSALMAPDPGEIIVSAGEHPAVRQYKDSLLRRGWKIATLPCPGGYASAEALKALLTPRTRFVFLMLVNNILGTVQPVGEIVQAVRDYERTTGRKIHVHTDAVQAAGKIPVDLERLGVDSAAFSGHKFQGPRGIGMLFNKDKGLRALSPGGGQERGLRPGTENLPAIAAMVAALEDALGRGATAVARARSLAEELLRKAGFRILSPRTAGSRPFSPFILNVATMGIPSEVFVRMMDDKGFSISAGSACNNNARRRLPGLGELGFGEREASTSVRLSFGWDVAEDDVRDLCQAMAEAAKGI